MIRILITVAIVGVLVWLLGALLPMPPIFHTLLPIVAIILVAIYLAKSSGNW